MRVSILLLSWPSVGRVLLLTVMESVLLVPSSLIWPKERPEVARGVDWPLETRVRVQLTSSVSWTVAVASADEVDGGVDDEGVDADGDGVVEVVPVAVGVAEAEVVVVAGDGGGADVGEGECRCCGVEDGVGWDVVAVGVGGVGGELDGGVGAGGGGEDAVPAVVGEGVADGGEAEGFAGDVLCAADEVVAGGPEGGGGVRGDPVEGVVGGGGFGLRESGGVLDADEAFGGGGFVGAVFDVDFDDVGAFVADDLVGVALVGVVEDRDLVPGGDDFAAGPFVDNAVVDALVAGHVAAAGAGVGVFVDAVDGVVHAVEAVAAVGRGVGGGPRHGGEVVGASEGGGCAVGGEVVGEGDVAVVADAELGFLDAEEEEGEVELDGGGCEAVVGVDVLLSALSVHPEGGVWRVVGDGVDVVVAVGELDGDVGHGGEDDLSLAAGDGGVPVALLVLREGDVVVLLFDLHFGAGALHFGPLVLAAVDDGAGGGVADGAAALGVQGGAEAGECYGQ